MARLNIWKRTIALLLVMTLLLTPVVQVSAQELPEGLPEPFLSEETDTPEAPDILESEVPDTPEMPDTPDVPDSPEEPDVPETPDTPEIPDTPDVPDSPEEPDVPEMPDTPENPDTPDTPDTPDVPDNPEESEIPEEPEISEEPNTPDLSDPTETTEPSEEPVRPSEPEESTVWSLGTAPTPVPIADVLKMEASEETILIEGTVVYAEYFQAVLQDTTGGIRLSFTEKPDIAPGDILQVTGCRSGGLAVETFEKTGTGELPAIEATLEEDRNALRILVKGAVLGSNSLSQNGYTCQLSATPAEGLEIGDRVDAWGVLLDAVFYADTMVPSENQPPEDNYESSWNFYFGQLHAHTNISDGLGTVEEAFTYASQVEELDFFAVTDHSNSFDNAEQGSIAADGNAISTEWAAGKAAADAVTNENFVGIFGYEMTWPEDLAIGHISTFGTSGWQTRDQPGMNTLEGYLDILAEAPESLSQFNHPGTVYGDFRNFSLYNSKYDARVHLLEVGGEGTFTAYDAYTTALDAGWHLAPSNNQNNHKGNWGSVSQARTVVLAQELSEEAIFDAVHNYRVYASTDSNLNIEYRLNNRIMGSILEETDTLTATVFLEDGSGDPIGQVEIITDGGKVAASASISEASGECSLQVPSGGSYYYLRIRRNGGITAVTAPVWVDQYEDLGIADLTAKTLRPQQGTPAEITLRLFNDENLPFVIDSVIFAAGSQIIHQADDPGSVEPLGEWELPLSHIQEAAGSLIITATVSGTIGTLQRSWQQTITLYYQPPKAELSSIQKTRTGMLGEVYRVRGYVTAGTANPYNTFPDSIYLQDDTAGIEIRDFIQVGVPLGTPMEVEGILRSEGGNLVLAMTNYEIPEEASYRHVPETMSHQEAMNYETHGGQLLQIEGHVVSMTKTASQLGVARFTLRDPMGDLATVLVDDDITSGAYGVNGLTTEVKAGRMVRAMGLLHIDEYGKPVLRVRNCDEVAYVPPILDPSNPRTGDWMARLLAWLQ